MVCRKFRHTTSLCSFPPPLHSTPYTPSWLSCARRWSAVSSFALPVGSVLAATPRGLLCPLPTGSPMTPASWGVRRMSFGCLYVVQTSALSRRASSCHWLNPRRICRVNPRLFVCLLSRISFEFPPPLHLTPYTLHPSSPPVLYTLSGTFASVVHPCRLFPPVGEYPCCLSSHGS